jgi:hypothetical protein
MSNKRNELVTTNNECSKNDSNVSDEEIYYLISPEKRRLIQKNMTIEEMKFRKDRHLFYKERGLPHRFLKK